MLLKSAHRSCFPDCLTMLSWGGEIINEQSLAQLSERYADVQGSLRPTACSRFQIKSAQIFLCSARHLEALDDSAVEKTTLQYTALHYTTIQYPPNFVRMVKSRTNYMGRACGKYNNNHNNNNKLQFGCHPVAVVILHLYKIWNWLLLNLSREGCMRSM